MDFQLLAIAAAIVIIVVVLVSCFLMVGTRERTFEDALAEQQGLNLLLSKDADVHQTGKKHQQKDVKKKKSVVKEPPKKEKKPEDREKLKKDAPQLSTTPTPSASIDGRTAEEDEAVASVDHDEPADHKDGGNLKKGSKKVSKKDKSRKKRTLSGNETDGSDHHATLTDDVQTHEEHPQDPEVVADESTNQQTEEPAHPTTEATKKQKKNKSKSSKNADAVEKMSHKPEEKPFVEESNVNSLLEKLKLPLLSDTQIDVISSFYSKTGEWSTAHSKPDPIVTLKKQLDEKDQQLAQEMQQLTVANQKLKDNKIEMAAEKQRFLATERTFKEQMTHKVTENQSLNQKLGQIQTELASKMQTYRQMESQLMQFRNAIEQANPAQLQQLREENQRLKERISSYDQEILTRQSDVQRMKQELITRENQIHRMEKTRQDLDQRCIQLETRALHDSGVNQQLADSQAKLIQKEKECLQLGDELNNLRKEWSLLEQNVGLMRKQLADRDAQAQQQTLQYTQSPSLSDSSAMIEMEKLRQDLNETRTQKESYCNELQKVNQRLTDLDKQITEMKKRASEQDQDQQKLLEHKDVDLARCSEEIRVLKMENEILSAQKNKNEDARYKELENALNSKNKLDADVQQLKHELDNLHQKLKEHETTEKDLRAELQTTILARKTAEADAENLKLELNSTKMNGEVDELQQHVAVLESTVVGRDNTVTKLEDQLKDLQQRCNDYESQLNVTRKQIEELTNENNIQSQRFQNLNNENAKLSDQIRIQQAVNGHSEVASVIIDPDVLKVNERSMAQLNKQLINKDCEVAHLKEQLEILRQKNIELRDKKYKAVESVQQMEKNTKELIDKIEDKCQKDNHQKEKMLRETLSKCLPNCPTNESSTFSEWLHEFERVVKTVSHPSVAVEPPIVVKHVAQSPDVSEVRIKLDHVMKDNDRLNNQLSTYKNVLAQTESLLNNLERNAIQDETKWREKYSLLETQLSEARQQSSSQHLHSSQEINIEIDNLKTALEKEKSQRESIIKELTVRERELETERSTGRDLSAQAVKLRGMLKTGQDALSHEQNLVSQLQKQLKALQDEHFQAGSGQIPEDDKGGRSLHEELEDLRNKLSQRESQLEKEMIINKQLNNKLASLGVSAAPSFNS